MNIGSFNLRVFEWGDGFRADCDFAGKHLWSGKRFLTKKEALDFGIKILERDIQDGLNDLKPKYQMKPKPVDAVQWFPSNMDFDCTHYSSQPIKPGDWIVNDKVITNEEFERDYEVVQ